MLWSAVALAAAALWVVQARSPEFAPYAAPVLGPLFAIAAVLAIALAWRNRTGVQDAARHVEQLHPELHNGLQAAVEQHPETNGRFDFLQRRVIEGVLQHAERHDWDRRARRRAGGWLGVHVLAMAAALGLSLLVVRAHRPASASPADSPAADVSEITPGDAEVERGSVVVVAARFQRSELPDEAVLAWQSAGRAAERAGMHRSLSDPVFAFTLPPVIADTSYHIAHGGTQTRAFTLTVFDRPALVRADATLDYPDYTGLADRRIADTRRVSAVVGTGLVYEFATNKPIARAILRGADGQSVPLDAANSERTQFRLTTIVTHSQRFNLQLTDDAGRANAAPIEIRIEALENRRPELKLTFPRGDLRVSPLEELRLQAEARDDFGLRDYGIGLSIADQPLEHVSLAAGEAPRPVQAAFDDLVALENHGVKPDQLITWFAWADDIGPDGEIRRTTSDVFFAEVRSLDEVFRENATGGGQNQPGAGGGGPGEELIETQRQISIAIWKLRQQDAREPAFAEDAGTLRDSQRQARQQLASVRERLEDPRARAAADEAAPLMTQASDALAAAAAQPSAEPLSAAWTQARGAYQALLRMQSRETQVAQSQGGGGGSSRSRDQLNQLEFRHEQDRYATETQAQPPPTPEEREQLQVLARLRELARRQQDLNSRLQELQTALAAAEDEAQREEIRRELKRLEDEQRRMLAELDETRQRVDRLQPGERTQEARRQLDATREDMRRAGEQLAGGEVSQALAAGTRAQENLQRTSEDFRRDAAGRFDEQMREARSRARELASQQQATAEALDGLAQGRQSLDDTAERGAIADQLEQQTHRREALLNTLRQVAEDSEAAEPRLHRQLYDLLRQQDQSGADQQLAAGAEMLRRGFVEPVRDQQAGLAQEFEQLQRAVERAASAVLGDETNELRFAQRELAELSRELRRERGDDATGDEPSNGERASATDEAAGARSAQTGGAGERDPAGRGERPAPGESAEEREFADTSLPREGDRGDSSPAQDGAEAGSSRRGSSESSAADAANPAPSGGGDGELATLEQLAREFGESARGEGARGPLSGAGFADWAERLRTVEELVESDDVRRQLATARSRAEEFRRAHQREGRSPQWEMVELGVVTPLEEARAWLQQELRRREQPDALQPIDRDPVPERYAEAVRKYYEALGAE